MPKVTGCDAFRVVMPKGRRPESILVRLQGADGSAGWGEVAVPALPDTTWSDIEERIGPALLGLEWDRPEDVSATSEFGTADAAAAVDIACWDLWCRGRGMPMAHALGGTRTSIVTGARVDRRTAVDTLVALVNRHVGGGHTRITIDIEPGWDVEPVRAVRQAYPTLALIVDGHGRYSESADDLSLLTALDTYDLLAIERPFRAGDLGPHTRLQQRVSCAVAPDIGDLDTLDAAIDQEAGRALALRISRFGGLTAARSAHDLAYAAGWGLWCRGSGSFGIGQAAAIALAALPGCTLPSDVSDPASGPAFVSPPVRPSGGLVAIPLTQPGLGHEIDHDRIVKLASRRLRIPA